MSTPQKMESASDLELIAAINAGDDAAFEVLYVRYRDWVVGLARQFTGCDSLANDVLQETFLYFLRKFPGFDLSSQLKTFLYPAVKNYSMNAHRKLARFQSGSDGQDEIDRLVAPPSPLGASDDIAAMLSGLSEDHREILMLRYVDGLSMAEIAEATAIPLGTAKSRLHHAIVRVRQESETRGCSQF
ncbi:MAG: sigma-70 family RNA polymerase sigma factor [Verrucomicrobiae bacterium]|nr:sigma-70 family RNA polymerase sigma factor [Verrucomicrobiae bacterium]MCP5534093.1 sigma-70 family RNA polymerase sigma factor [Akkermansiaceae bacterium]MCP5545120.1 sigma-70 family RNA polymerase sigma factor [Akkermansiaceae bacterium]MCP5546659.1 sigma-70 family RNA polymerase sigma factor [Akkermansiaceae bacterium]